jgi:lysozyme family protein
VILDTTFDTLWDFERCYAKVCQFEGGLSLDPNDRGNWTLGEVGKGELRGTNFGISAASYPLENIKGLTLERAKFLTKRDYWDRNSCDQMPQSIVLPFFDMAFNSGERNCAKVLLQCVGMETVGIINARVLDEVHKMDETVLKTKFLGYRILFLADIKSFNIYARGWMRRIGQQLIEE